MRRIEVKKGDRYNELTVIRELPEREELSGKRRRIILCKCSCGNESIVLLSNLRIGKTKSCGCLRKIGIYKHGMINTKIYLIWNAMKQRCFNKKHPAYKKYGGRGITVCKSWLQFENFYKDIGEKPEKLSLDRLDNNKGYSKENCRWATSKQQNNNRRDNVLFLYKGKKVSIVTLSKKFKIKYETLYQRIRRGESTEQATDKYFRRNSVLTNYQGRKITIKELSEKVGVNYHKLYMRIMKYDWSVDRAIIDKIEDNF